MMMNELSIIDGLKDKNNNANNYTTFSNYIRNVLIEDEVIVL